MELLQNLDPTFWCLDDFIALADQTSQHSSASFQELVNLYVSSLTCQYLGSQNYYYDKSVLFDAPQLLVGAIRRCEAVDLFCDDLPARLAIRKLRQIAHRHSADPHSLYLKCCDNWPSETQMCALIKRFGCFDGLFPLKKCQARSQLCLDSFEPELQKCMLRCRAPPGPPHAPPAAPQAAKSLNEIFTDTRHIVENKFRVDNHPRSTPRKRCFDFVAMDFNFGSARSGPSRPQAGNPAANNENCCGRALATPKRMKFSNGGYL